MRLLSVTLKSDGFSLPDSIDSVQIWHIVEEEPHSFAREQDNFSITKMSLKEDLNLTYDFLSETPVIHTAAD